MLPGFHGQSVNQSSAVTHHPVHVVTYPPTLTAINFSNVFYNFSTITSFNVATTFTNVTESRQKLTLEFQITFIFLYTLTTIAAVVGNSLAILVFAKGRRSNTDLRHFLLNLAVADLIMAIFCIPFTLVYQILDTWIFSALLCPVVSGCQVVSVTASVSTNTAIGVDRFLAVKFPLQARVTHSRSKLFIFSIWIFALSFGAIAFGMTRTVQKKDGRIACEEDFQDEKIQVMYGFSVTVITYFLPVTVLSVTYIMIGKLLWRHRLPGNADNHRDATQLRSKKKVVKMLITIVLLFGLCWLPLHLFITITMTFKQNVFGDLANKIYFGVHWLSMANSFMNPLIYGLMNDNFRTDLRCLAESCGCYSGRRRNLKYRPAAVRRRLGCSNVQDFSRPSLHSLKWDLNHDGRRKVSQLMLHKCSLENINGEKRQSITQT